MVDGPSAYAAEAADNAGTRAANRIRIPARAGSRRVNTVDSLGRSIPFAVEGRARGPPLRPVWGGTSGSIPRGTTRASPDGGRRGDVHPEGDAVRAHPSRDGPDG